MLALWTVPFEREITLEQRFPSNFIFLSGIVSENKGSIDIKQYQEIKQNLKTLE